MHVLNCYSKHVRNEDRKFIGKRSLLFGVQVPQSNSLVQSVR